MFEEGLWKKFGGAFDDECSVTKTDRSAQCGVSIWSMRCRQHRSRSMFPLSEQRVLVTRIIQPHRLTISTCADYEGLYASCETWPDARAAPEEATRADAGIPPNTRRRLRRQRA